MLKGQYPKVSVIWVSPACLRPIVFKQQPDAASWEALSPARLCRAGFLSFFWDPRLFSLTVCVVCVHTHTSQAACDLHPLSPAHYQWSKVGGQSSHNSREGHPHLHAFTLCPHSQAKWPGGMWELSPHLPEPRGQPVLSYFITK